MKILFWNLQRKSLDGLIVRLVEDHRISILVLIEHPENSSQLIDILKGIGNFHRLPSHDRFGIYIRFRLKCMNRITPPLENTRMDCWELKRGLSYQSVNLVVVHGLDMRNHCEGHRILFFERVTENIQWLESMVGHKRTIVLGDMNANPFDPPISSCRGLHAIPMTAVNSKNYRRVLGQNYEFFYNPMWRCYGTDDHSHQATYFYYNYQEDEIFWYMIDQVVIRPSVIPYFQPKGLRILNQAGGIPLTNKQNIPDNIRASDHLPVIFQLNLRQ